MVSNLLRIVTAASALTMAYSQTLANDNYQIKSVSQARFARNFAETQIPSAITFNDFISFERNDFTWHVAKRPGDVVFTLTNIALGNAAAVITQELGVHVEGLNNMTTQFAIESAGNGNFVIKSPNADLLWAVFDDGTSSYVLFLEHANGGDE